jgi:hypothetical protein
MKSALLCMVVVVGLVLCIACPAKADCTKWAKGDLYFTVEYQMPFSGRVCTVRLIGSDYIRRSGYYGGGCRTAVGRGKARKRARRAVAKAIRADIGTDWFKQASFVCRMILDRSTDSHKEFYEYISEAEWMRVKVFRYEVYDLDGSQRSASIPVYYRALQQKFKCRNRGAYMVND